MANLPTNRSTQRPANRSTQRPALSRDRMSDYLKRARAGADEKFQVAFYSTDAKARLVDEHTVLYLSACKLEDGKFGARWVLTLHENEAAGTSGLLTLPDNSWRTIYFENLQILISRFGTIGPMQLSMRETKNGPAFDLIEWTDDDEPAGQVDADGNDLPF